MPNLVSIISLSWCAMFPWWSPKKIQLVRTIACQKWFSNNKADFYPRENSLFLIMKAWVCIRAVVTSPQESSMRYPKVRFPNSRSWFISSSVCTIIREWTRRAVLNLYNTIRYIIYKYTLIKCVQWSVVYVYYLSHVRFSRPSSFTVIVTLSWIGNNPPIMMSPSAVASLEHFVPEKWCDKTARKMLKEFFIFPVCFLWV